MDRNGIGVVEDPARFPKTLGSGTIPSRRARIDDLNDLIGARLRRLWAARTRSSGWTAELEQQRRDLEQMCATNGYEVLTVDPRDYLVNLVGQSLLYEVPTDKQGKLKPFTGKRVRVICLRSGWYERDVAIGVVGEAPNVGRQYDRSRPKPEKPKLPRLLHRHELATTPHLIARFSGHWNGAAGMIDAFNRALRYQAAAWHARRFFDLAGEWPQGTHIFDIRYGPTSHHVIRTPIGDGEGSREIVLYFEIRPDGAEFTEGNEKVGFRWCAFALEDLRLAQAE